MCWVGKPKAPANTEEPEHGLPELAEREVDDERHRKQQHTATADPRVCAHPEMSNPTFPF